MPNHVHAGSGGRDNDTLSSAEHVKPSACHLSRLIPVSAIEERLAAAGLFLGEIYLSPQSFQECHHALENAREELLCETGDEELDTSGHESIGWLQ